ncbi:MAG: glycosyltransferase family 2 protein [Lachnospiraceae bacterium]|nr:glycosyltransferase family 2 protein [Lachnospiraceae bacterium]
MKLLSVAIPCYNSENYMRHAVETLLVGGEDVEIIIVDDGSSDRTYEIGLELQEAHPGIVKVVHQENAGHGGAVNTGLKEATGLYFKVVDSDDWVKEEALLEALATLKGLVADSAAPDMFICNYVYEKVGEKKKRVIHYRNCMPQDCIFTWDDVSHFRTGQFILMHSVIYRTKLLKDCGLELPKHTFYVDNIYVYQPLPQVKTMYYKDLNLYRYFIGREDQSVNENNMMKRIDQQLLVTRTIIDLHDLTKLKCRSLRSYMSKYLMIMMTISSVFLIKIGTEEALQKKDELWQYLENKNKRMYRDISRTVLGTSSKTQSRPGQEVVKFGYEIARKLFQFN